MKNIFVGWLGCRGICNPKRTLLGKWRQVQKVCRILRQNFATRKNALLPFFTTQIGWIRSLPFRSSQSRQSSATDFGNGPSLSTLTWFNNTFNDHMIWQDEMWSFLLYALMYKRWRHNFLSSILKTSAKSHLLILVKQQPALTPSYPV